MINSNVDLSSITKCFSDFARGIDKPSEHQNQKKIKIDDVLDKEILAVSFTKGKSKFNDGKDYLRLIIKIDNESRVILTGSSVLLRQCEDYEKEFPFRTKIIKSGMAYSFS